MRKNNKEIMIARNISWYFAMFLTGMFLSLTLSEKYYDGCTIAIVAIVFYIASYILARFEHM